MDVQVSREAGCREQLAVTKQSPCYSPSILNGAEHFHDEIKYQVLAGRVNAQPLVQFIPTLPQFRVIRQFSTDIAQAIEIMPGLLHTPRLNGVIPDRVDIGSCLRPQPDFSHDSGRLP